MNKSIIIEYIKKITKEAINNSAIKQHTPLTNNELNIIYDYIKNKTIAILENPLKIINKIKNNLSTPVYHKLLELYDKYKIFLNKLK